MKPANPFPRLLHVFFYEWLVQQRNASVHTVRSYRGTWRLFLRFAAQRWRRAVAQITLVDLTVSEVSAFLQHAREGMSEEDIAAAFFVGVNVVKQRLRLAAVSAKLLDIYADDGMSLEQLMSFTVTTDHARQEQVWEALQQSWNKEPFHIRRMLTERTIPSSPCPTGW